MARNFLNGINLNLTQILNAVAQIIATDPAITEGRFYYNSTRKTWVFHTDAAIINLGRLDQISAPTAALNLNGQRITSLADGVAGTDAATLQQVQALVNTINSGQAWKDSARVYVSSNANIASPGATLDGVSFAAGDQNKRVVLGGQTNGAENGVYDWNGASAPMTRSVDADTAADLVGAVIPIEQGTQQDTVWMLTTDAITLGTTAIAFTKIYGGNAVTLRKYAQTYGGSASQAITHNLGTTDVTVQVRDATTNAVVEPDITITDANTVTLVEATAPAASSRRVVIVG